VLADLNHSAANELGSGVIVRRPLLTGVATTVRLCEAMVGGIISIDERGAIQTINRAGARQFGYTQDEVIGKNLKILMPSPYQEEHDRYRAHNSGTGEKRIGSTGSCNSFPDGVESSMPYLESVVRDLKSDI
jgi:PAS domain S-box-containing protein